MCLNTHPYYTPLVYILYIHTLKTHFCVDYVMCIRVSITINTLSIHIFNTRNCNTHSKHIFVSLSFFPIGIALLHALAKDNLLPMSATWFSQLDASLYQTNAMILFCILTSLVLLGELIESENGDITVGGSHMAFFSILQTCNFAFQVSFAIPICLKITCICPMAYRALTKGGWYLESASFPLGIIAFSWLALTALLELLPMKYPVTASNMNYTVRMPTETENGYI